MGEPLLSQLRQYVLELEQKEAANRYPVPEGVLKAVRRAKSLEKFLHELFVQVSGSGGIDLLSAIRREFGIDAELMDHFAQWAPYSKEQFEEELHDAIDRADIRAGNQGMFFEGTPGKQEAEEALRLLKEIAHAAVRIQFRREKWGQDLYVDILDKLLQFYALPNTYPEGNVVNYRNLISADRLYAMAGCDETVTRALMAFCKMWYQQSPFTFLESKEGYFSYAYVQHFLYALTEEQLERLRHDYLHSIEDEFKKVRDKPNLLQAKKLLAMLETVLGWKEIHFLPINTG